MKKLLLGDFIHMVTSSVGIKACEGCQKRREALNILDSAEEKATLSQLMRAILNPEEVIHAHEEACQKDYDQLLEEAVEEAAEDFGETPH